MALAKRKARPEPLFVAAKQLTPSAGHPFNQKLNQLLDEDYTTPTSVQCHHNIRGDKTQLELFIAGVRGWEAYARRRLDDGKPVEHVA